MKIEHESSFRAALLDGITLFAGAGFSIHAINGADQALPLGAELVGELVSHFSLSTVAGWDLQRVVTVIEHTNRDELRDFLRHRMTVSEYDPRYNALSNLSIHTLFTTNIDDLPNCIYAGSDKRYLNDVYSAGASFRDRSSVTFVPLHGSVRDETRPFRFGAVDLVTAFSADPSRWSYLAHLLEQGPALFWGYSATDPGALYAQSLLSESARSANDIWAVVPPSAQAEADEAFFRSLGFQIIGASTTDLLDYVGDLLSQQLPDPGTHAPPALTTREMFPEFAVPAVSEIVRRSVLEFFMGAPPQWSDIYSADLHRTSHFREVRDRMNTHRQVAIVGIPACGKTTLLMQIAAYDKSHGHKLMLDSLTRDKGELLASRLGGGQATVFVDNLADSMDGLEPLCAQDGVRIVAAERDYNFEIVRHRLRGEWSVVDVTELSAADIQQCLASIPDSVKNPVQQVGLTRPAEGTTQQPSLFEIMERNIKGPSIKGRFKNVLAELKACSPVRHLLLVMICYVYACRTPVSMNMLMAFLRGDIDHYRDVYEHVNGLGKMVAEYIGELADENQDYFIPRSTIIGETVLEIAPRASLAQMLDRFHRQVSPLSICRYDTFCRHAYDNVTMLRAFPTWEAGMALYDLIYRRDQSPYVLQQAALYLAKLGEYGLAFDYIDRALVGSGHKVWSIQNSHAIILFKANIPRANAEGARGQLRRSMRILTECIEADRRKPYHACTFAEQAIQYWQAYRDAEAAQYLADALSWLEDERENSPWNRHVRALLPRLKAVVEDSA